MDHEPAPSPSRRRLITGAVALGVLGWVWGVPKLAQLGAPALALSPVPGAPGFRALEGAVGLTAGQQALFAGIEATDPAVDRALALVRENPCRALYGDAPAPVPVALFSDFNCPNCPVMDANVTAVLARTADTSLHRHQLPLLGRASETASRAVLAADLQGGYAALHARLTRTPAVTDMALITQIAAQEGLDPERLRTDMARPAIAGALDRSRALSRYLGLIGTPAAVIGRTVVLGTLPEATIAEIIALEMERGRPCL